MTTILLREKIIRKAAKSIDIVFVARALFIGRNIYCFRPCTPPQPSLLENAIAAHHITILHAHPRKQLHLETLCVPRKPSYPLLYPPRIRLAAAYGYYVPQPADGGFLTKTQKCSGALPCCDQLRANRQPPTANHQPPTTNEWPILWPLAAAARSEVKCDVVPRSSSSTSLLCSSVLASIVRSFVKRW